MADDFDPNAPVFVYMKPPKGVAGLTDDGTYPRVSREAFEAVFADKGWTVTEDDRPSEKSTPSTSTTPKS